MSMMVEETVKRLHVQANPKNVAGMARLGINPKSTLGVSIPFLRNVAKDIKKSYKHDGAARHQLALDLWKTRLHEARILAGMIDDPALVTKKQMEEWVADFDSWDVCDQVCSNLFDKTAFAKDMLFQWVTRREEYVKRAGFVLMACLAVHDKANENLQKAAIDVAREIARMDVKSSQWVARDALRELESRKI